MSSLGSTVREDPLAHFISVPDEPEPEPGQTTLLDRMAAFLAGPRPQTLLVRGPTGAGKSSLIRALLDRTSVPRVYVVYRLLAGGGNEIGPDLNAPVAVRLFDPDPPVSDRGKGEGTEFSDGAPTGAPSTSGLGLPQDLSEAYSRLRARKGGIVFVDEWAPHVEADFAHASPGALTTEWFSTRTSDLLNRGEREGLSIVMASSFLGGPGVDSLANEIVELGDEHWDGPPFRVMRLRKHFWGTEPDPKWIYRLNAGEFIGEEPFRGVPDHLEAPDPEPRNFRGGIWPGSASFATAFGVLRYHSITGVLIPPRLPNAHVDAIVLPAIAHVLRSGGRVAWVPPVCTLPMRACAQLEQIVPEAFMADRLRILSAAGRDPAMGELSQVVLMNHRTLGTGGGDVRSAMAAPVGPMFREVHQFLQGTPSGKPALFVLNLDGLRALAIASQISYDSNTFPMVIAQYARLPGFHGIGVAHTDDPLVGSTIPSVETLLYLDVRYGRTVLYGSRPRTAAHLLVQRPGQVTGTWEPL